MKITVANAPISYGAFELTVGIDPNTPDAEFVLNEVAEAGYAGIDLGPVGYLGDGPVLAERLASRNLGLAGAYLEFPFTDPVALEKLYPDLDAMLDTFDAVRDAVPGPLPRPTIADASSDTRRLYPGQSQSNPSLGLANDDWKRFEIGLKAVLARCRDRGYEPTFHPETGTFVEAPWEIERVLEISDVGLCLETGHIFVCGGDPLEVLRSSPDRVNHVHLKDASRSRMDSVIADHEPTPAIWSREVFCALGDGDVDLDGVLKELERLNFEGWLVVEQDIFPQTAARFAQAVIDQKNNRQFLASRGI
ncbi:MAG TPA: TIM barrel protein [Acidimicrobiales bacterium]|jgi:inosose dehydratase|nr:TIM barrel protein [Acidimicrobiales bacterium]